MCEGVGSLVNVDIFVLFLGGRGGFDPEMRFLCIPPLVPFTPFFGFCGEFSFEGGELGFGFSILRVELTVFPLKHSVPPLQVFIISGDSTNSVRDIGR